MKLLLFLCPFILTISDLTNIEYLFPIKWKCSCNLNKEYVGWMVKKDGKYYRVEGDRKDGKQSSSYYYNPNKK